MKIIRSLLPAVMVFLATSAAGQSYFAITYNMAFPMGNTKEFIPETSLRGFGVEAGGWIKKDISAGLSFAWNGFYQEVDYDTYGPEDGLPDHLNLWTKAWKYTTVYPFTGIVKYYLPSKSGLKVYIGTGIGASYISRVMDLGVYSLVDKNLHLTIAPEAGIIYWVSDNLGFILNGRYSWSSKAGDVDPQSYMGFNMGIIVDSF